jgi:hypothetical protein
VSTVRAVWLSCDHDSCHHTITLTKPVQSRAEAAGWVRVGTRDYCPAHTPTTPASRFAHCPRPGCGRRVQVLADGSLRRHRLLLDGDRLGPTCRDPHTGRVHTRYRDLEAPCG